MTTNYILDVLKSRLEKEVASHIKLQKAREKESEEIELVNPIVAIGYLPPSSYLPKGYTTIPAILVGIDEGEDNNDEASINIRLTFAVYGPGTHKEGKWAPDFEGYRDLLNLIERTKINLFSNPIIEGRTTVSKPIRWGMYEEQPYPYWYGWMSFKANYPKIEAVLTNIL